MELSIDSGLIVIILLIWILVLIFGYREINELMDFRSDIQLNIGSDILSISGIKCDKHAFVSLWYDNISNQVSIDQEVRSSIEEWGRLEDSTRA